MAISRARQQPRWATVLAVGLPVAVFLLMWLPVLRVAPAGRSEALALSYAQLPPMKLWDASAPTHAGFAWYLVLAPLARLPNPVLAVRRASVIAAAAGIGLASLTAARLWGAGAALAAGLALVCQPAVFLSAILVSPEPLAFALGALATWVLVVRLESYESLGSGASAGYGLALTLAVLISPFAVVLMLAHLAYAIAMRANRDGWRQLATGWGWALIAAVVGFAMWPRVPDWAPGLTLHGIGITWWVVSGVAVALIVAGIIASDGKAFFDTGLLLALMLLGGAALGLWAGPIWATLPGLGGHQGGVALCSTLGLSLLAGCAAGQFGWSKLRRAVTVVMVLALVWAGFRTIPSNQPAKYSAEGNPALARDVKASAVGASYLVVWQHNQSDAGLVAALALALSDTGLLQRSASMFTVPTSHVSPSGSASSGGSPSNSSASAGSAMVASKIDSTSPWRTSLADPAQVSGKVILVNLGDHASGVPPQCIVVSSDRYRDANLAVLRCG